MYRLELDSVTLNTVLVAVKRSDIKHGCEPWLLRGFLRYYKPGRISARGVKQGLDRENKL